jgi:hypothetical protein
MLSLALLLTGCSQLATTQAVINRCQAFMTALAEADYPVAFALCHPELQAKIGSASGLEDMLEGDRALPREWTFTSWKQTSRPEQGKSARVSGSLTYRDGLPGAVTLELIETGDTWQITHFALK